MNIKIFKKMNKFCHQWIKKKNHIFPLALSRLSWTTSLPSSPHAPRKEVILLSSRDVPLMLHPTCIRYQEKLIVSNIVSSCFRSPTPCSHNILHMVVPLETTPCKGDALVEQFILLGRTLEKPNFQKSSHRHMSAKWYCIWNSIAKFHTVKPSQKRRHSFQFI